MVTATDVWWWYTDYSEDVEVDAGRQLRQQQRQCVARSRHGHRYQPDQRGVRRIRQVSAESARRSRRHQRTSVIPARYVDHSISSSPSSSSAAALSSLDICGVPITSRTQAPNNNNNNNTPRTIFIALSSWPLKVIARVHSVHLMNAAQRTIGCRPSDQATWLGLWVGLF